MPFLPKRFVKACVSGDVSLVREILEDEEGVSLQDISEDGWRSTALHVACKGGHIEVVRELLRRGVEVDAVDICGKSSLHCVCEIGSVEILRELLKHGANVELASSWMTPIWYASKCGHVEAVRELLSSGASLQCNYQLPPLHVACANGHLEVVKVLLDQGVNINHQDAYGATPLHYASKTTLTLNVVRELLSRGASVMIRDKSGNSPFDYGSGGVLDALVTGVLSSGTSVNWQDKRGHTFLHTAVVHGEMELVERLLGLGADFELCTLKGESALLLACKADRVDAVRELLSRGVSVDLKEIMDHVSGEETRRLLEDYCSGTWYVMK